MCVVLSATHVPVELAVLYVFDTSAVWRSICVFQRGLRMFERQSDLRGEPVVIGQSTIELTEQVKPPIVMVECVFIDLMVSLSE